MKKNRYWILIARKFAGEASNEDINELESLLKIKPELFFQMEIIQNWWNLKPVDNSKEAKVEKLLEFIKKHPGNKICNN